jgi:hypothetical protein
VPCAAATIAQHGKCVCAVTAQRDGRLLRVAGGPQLQPADAAAREERAWQSSNPPVVPPLPFQPFFLENYACNNHNTACSFASSIEQRYGRQPAPQFSPLVSHHALCELPLPALGAAATTWSVRLHTLSAGAVLGVATSAADVYGVLMLGAAMTPWGSTFTLPQSWLLGGYSCIDIQHISPGGGQMLAVVAGVTNISHQVAPGMQLQVGRWAVSGHVLVFVLGSLQSDGSRFLSVSCVGDVDVAAHSMPEPCHDSLASRLFVKLPPLPKAPAGEAPPAWRMYVQPMPGDGVTLGHSFDMAHPEQPPEGM